MGFSVDKRLKIDKPLGTVYSSTDPRPINFADTAPSETMRADEIAIKTAKTGTVTVVVAVMSIFSKKDGSHGARILRMRTLLAKRRKVPISGGKFPHIEKPFSENKKRPVTKEISI